MLEVSNPCSLIEIRTWNGLYIFFELLQFAETGLHVRQEGIVNVCGT